MLRVLPANVYWKNKEGYYLGCNEGMIECGLITSEKDFVGTSLKDHGHLLDVSQFEEVDNQIMNNGKPMCLFEKAHVKGFPTFLTTKYPLFAAEGFINGLIGISFNISRITNYQRFFPLLCSDDLPSKIILQKLEENFFKKLAANNILLSQREKECLSYFRQGRSNREIAAFLNISTRTVETHVNSIKNKFACNTKSQLLDKLEDYND